MKQWKWAVLGLAVMGLFFSSCGKKGEGDTSLKLKETGDVVLTFAMWGTPEEKLAVYKVLQEFQKKHPNIGLKVIHTDSLSFGDKLQTMYAGGTPPDVHYLHVESFYDYASKGLLYPLDEFVNDPDFQFEDFYPSLVDAFRFGGELYGIPKDWTTFAIYYNMDMFDKEGVAYPNEKWTWDDLIKAAQKLTKDSNGDGVPDQYGWLNETWANWYYNFILQNGGEIFDAKGNWVLADPKYLNANAEAIQFVADTMNKYKVAPSVTASRELGGDASFVAGQTAMCMYGRWVQLRFKNIDKFKWNLSQLPRKKNKVSVVVTVSLSINANTKHPKEAWELVKFLTSYEGQVFTAEGGLAVPSRKSLVASDSYLKSKEVLVNQPHLARNKPEEDPFIAQLPGAKLPPLVPSWIEVRQKLDEPLEDVFFGRKDAKSVILALDSIVKDIMALKSQAAVSGSEE
jgi:multiple sugar transport system substrate-binding protein